MTKSNSNWSCSVYQEGNQWIVETIDKYGSQKTYWDHEYEADIWAAFCNPKDNLKRKEKIWLDTAQSKNLGWAQKYSCAD